MSRNKRGFTLVEVVIAMFILMIGMLALLNTAAVVISNNMLNSMRDEAVRVAQGEMDNLRNNPSLPPQLWDNPCPTETRYFRGISVNYAVCKRITALSSDNNTLQIDVAVGWDYKGSGSSTGPTYKKYQHTVSSVVRIGS